MCDCGLAGADVPLAAVELGARDLAHSIDERVVALAGFGHDAVEFDAVAGGEHERLGDLRPPCRRAGELGAAPGELGEALARGDRRGAVREADDEELHAALVALPGSFRKR